MGLCRARLVSGRKNGLERHCSRALLADRRRRRSRTIRSDMGGSHAAAAIGSLHLSRERRGLSAIAPTPARNHLGRRTNWLGRSVYLLSRGTFLPPVPYLPPVCGSCLARSRLADLTFLGLPPSRSRVATAARRQDCCATNGGATWRVTLNDAESACGTEHVSGVFSVAQVPNRGRLGDSPTDRL